ncbi:DUF2726 domain-containing protein [Thioalbus denitrificans]|uniref:Topoisomerase-like DNA binding C4 zinc finger protein n=1 Tax=Thioalbus denitrificans TaxID=547122 RepID=A0A369CHH4_9GAMM|nr:DUF2726 domain-containing protein [Thioalbus denitrificans]RCX31294.1 topoisomerase-like DNA binding C4 zinc finger protein [Thioalbus denitrificans]
MIWAILAVVVVVLVLVLVLLAAKPKRADKPDEEFPYEKRDALFTPAERSFLGVLDQAVGERYRIFGKVRVADVVDVWRRLGRSDSSSAWNRIRSKHFDFLLCAWDDLSVACAIELDDRSHQRADRKARDDFLTGVCHAAGLPLVQVQAQRAYTVSELRDRVLGALGQQGSTGAKTAEVVAPPLVAPVGMPVPDESAGGVAESDGDAEEQAPPCPKCGAPMVRRQARSGSNAGRIFWGCSTYPRCRGMVQDAQEPVPDVVAQ